MIEQNIKKETIKKNIFLVLTLLFAIIFLGVLSFIVFGDELRLTYITNNPIKSTLIPFVPFVIFLGLYNQSVNRLELWQSDEI